MFGVRATSSVHPRVLAAEECDLGYLGDPAVAARPRQEGERPCLQLPLWHCAQRMFASQTEGELKVTQVLKEKFPRATAIQVTDISGGCGAMYEIKIESEEFKEKRTVQQHQMVNQALKEEIKGMHGLRIFTSVPKC
uniref:BolA-like protein 3 n=1 Tax=Mus spicilegus TaxID=10103 RepID=A0A8C6IJM8_MUSSI